MSSDWNLDLAGAPDKPLPREVALQQTTRGSQGAPSLLTDEVAAKICGAVANGNYFNVAAGAAGIAYETLRSWIRRGNSDEEKGRDTSYVRFMRALAQAQHEHEQRLVATLSAGGAGKFSDWRAQAFVLERRHRDRWGPPQTQAPAVTIVLSNEQLQALSESMRLVTARDMTPEKPV